MSHILYISCFIVKINKFKQIYFSGLCGEGISFQMRQYPDYFLSYVDKINSGQFDGILGRDLPGSNLGENTRLAACFRPIRGRYQPDSEEPLVAFESYYRRGRYLYYEKDRFLFTVTDDLSADFE